MKSHRTPRKPDYEGRMTDRLLRQKPKAGRGRLGAKENVSQEIATPHAAPDRKPMDCGDVFWSWALRP